MDSAPIEAFHHADRSAKGARSPSRLDDLEGMRGFFAIAVVMAHLNSVDNPHSHWLTVILAWFWTCMDLFFCMSGYFIGRQVLERRDSPSFWSVFLKRRALRIWPVYFVVLFLTVLLTLAINPPAHPSIALQWHSWWKYLFFVQLCDLYVWPHLMVSDGLPAFLHSWSVAAEEQFYLLVPAYIALVVGAARARSAKLRKGLLLALFIAPVAASLYLRTVGVPIYVLGSRSDAFVGGVLVAWIQHQAGRRPDVNHAIRLSIRRLLPITLIAVTALGVLQVMIVYQEGFPDFSLSPKVLGITFAALISSIVVASCAFGASRRLSRLFAARPFPFLGRISYSTYMWHYPIIAFLPPVLYPLRMPFLLEIGSLLTVIYGVSYLSYRFIEQPANRWKPQFTA